MTEQEVWAVVVEYEALLKKEIRRYLPRSRWARDFDDMYADVVLCRAHAILRDFDPARGTKPITKLLKNCKWYAFEWALNRKYKKRVPTVSYDAAPTHAYVYVGERVRLKISEMLEGLPEDLAWVMRCLYERGNTHQEIAEHAGWETREVRSLERVARFLIEFNHA